MSVGRATPTFPFPWSSARHPLLDVAGAIGYAFVILIITYLIARLVSRRLRALLERGQMGPSAALLLTRTLWIAVWAVGVLYVLYGSGSGLTPLSAFIGVVGLAASLSLQSVLQNLVAGIYLLAERPFAIGDTICVVGAAGLNHEGVVQDIQIRTTHLRSQNDELILVPNAAIFSGVITNRTAVGGFANQVTVTFPRGSDVNEVRGRVLSVLAGVPLVLSQPVPQMRVDTVSKEQWTATVSFWSGSFDGASDAVWAIAHAFPDATINDAAEVPA